MVACFQCGHENPDGAKFCMECASPLGAPARAAAEERKVVTALFCDLVGFTAASESTDPEDVRQVLAAYFAVARAQIEAHGGVVEKFIGDAVAGVFGVPSAHEDDPERAVRAGLRIVEDAERLQGIGSGSLRLRVGINTGEALVQLGASTTSGEGFMTGDAINTAARIQSVAPVMGVAVGLATYEFTAVVFDYDELAPALVKGKAEPVRVFHARTSRARFGTDLTRTHDTPFVGREADLTMLKGVFDKTVAARTVQLVTVVGEPGLGKSRIVGELFAYADSQRELVNWRQGRCLPYGEGITFWALGEILKAHAGVLESDTHDVAAKKLDKVLPPGGEQEWFKQRLLPLLGIEASSLAEREELFTAWRRFFENVAEERTTVLVFEDLHWADEAMLAFLEHLADYAERVPLLLVGTARPELYERRADYGARLRNTTTVNLTPLSAEETARLVSALLDTTVLPAELQQPILDRSGGNPLFAHEFVRLLRDRNLLVEKGSSWQLREGAEVPLPGTVQALIAARLDTLDPDAKSLLADGAVIGKVFWAGAVAAMGDRDPDTVTGALRELSRKELVWPTRRSSMEGEAEYAFGHALVRDVAYAQLPRAARASRHVAAATWIEGKVEGRVEDLADVLAYHYATALDLARAAGQDDYATELEAPALRFLTLAGERALGLDTATALLSFERALAVAPPGHPGRPAALAHYGQAARDAGRYTKAAEALDEAITSLRAQGELAVAARAMLTLAGVLRRLADPRGWKLPAEALTLLEPLPPGTVHVAALTEMSYVETQTGRPEAGLEYAERALSLSRELGLDPPARALGFRGMARSGLGDAFGERDDVRAAIELATRAGQGRDAAGLYNNLGVFLWQFEGPVASLEAIRAGIAFAQQRGLIEISDFMTGNTLHLLVDSGALDEALELAATLAGHLTDEVVGDQILVRAARAQVLALRGLATEVAGTLDWLESASRADGVVDYLRFAGLSASAVTRSALAENDRAAALLAELDANPGAPEHGNFDAAGAAMVRTAVAAGDRSLAERLAAHVEPHYPYAEHTLTAANAALAEARGDLQDAADAYADAAERWQRFGVVAEQAFALLGRGRCLVELGQPPADALAEARELFVRLRAAPALAETDALLQHSRTLSA